MTGDMRSEITEKAGKVEELIASAKNLLAEGGAVDLAALEIRARSLCDEIFTSCNAYDDESKARVGALVAAILEDLESLEAELTAQHQAKCNKGSDHGY